jgi:hypothetical protein
MRRLVQNGKARRYTVQELNAVLAVMRNRDVLVMQDGSIIAVESAS